MYQCVAFHLSVFSPHKARAHLHTERIDKQHQAEVLGKEQHTLVDGDAEVSRSDTRKEDKGNTKRNTPQSHLAEDKTYGTD